MYNLKEFGTFLKYNQNTQHHQTDYMTEAVYLSCPYHPE